MILLLVVTNAEHRLTDLHLSKLIMAVLTFRDVSKFAGVNTANAFSIYDQFELLSIVFCYKGMLMIKLKLHLNENEIKSAP